MMMMQLSYPAVAMSFFGGLFELITFDLVPSDLVWEEVFTFENVPYSEQAEAIGYESRYAIYNSGSIPIFIALTVLK